MLHQPDYQTLKFEQRERLERAERQRLVLEAKQSSGRTWSLRLDRFVDRLPAFGRRRSLASRPTASFRA